ncbi:MAG: bacteriohemerythrin [Nitrospirota bacterium]
MSINWTEDIAVGVDEIDNQHKELFNRINSFLDAMNQGAGIQEVGNVIKFLEDYVLTHFGAEEGFMTKHKYPEHQSHKAQHEVYLKNLSDLKKEFESGGVTLPLTLKVQRNIVDWIINHIRKIDKALGAFLKTKM